MNKKISYSFKFGFFLGKDKESRCCCDELTAFLNDIPNNSIIRFKNVSLRLNDRVVIKGKKNIVLDGGGIKVVSHFDPFAGFAGYNGVFGFEDCENVVLKNFILDTDSAVNTAGKIVGINSAEKYVDVRIFDDCEFKDNSTVFATNSTDRFGRFDYTVSSVKPSSYEKLDEKTVRIKYADELCGDISKLTNEHNMCIRFGVGNYLTLKNSTVIFKNCKNFYIKNFKIVSSPGYATVIFPRCENFTFDKYIIKKQKNDGRLMASNIDALHVFGICGYLNLKNCCFSGLGDDALNIHSTAGSVRERLKEGVLKVNNARFDIDLENEWCRAGDRLAFYGKDFKLKAYSTVKSFEKDILTVEPSDKIEIGDIVANTSYYAKTSVKNCCVEKSRARGLLFQTENITVKDCKFKDISMPAILMAPDIRIWHEVGPCKNVTVENNIFKSCNFTSFVEDTGVITSSDSHDISAKSVNCIHGNITVKCNLFIGCKKPFSLKAVKGYAVKNNLFFGGNYG